MIDEKGSETNVSLNLKKLTRHEVLTERTRERLVKKKARLLERVSFINHLLDKPVSKSKKKERENVNSLSSPS